MCVDRYHATLNLDETIGVAAQHLRNGPVTAPVRQHTLLRNQDISGGAPPGSWYSDYVMKMKEQCVRQASWTIDNSKAIYQQAS